VVLPGETYIVAAGKAVGDMVWLVLLSGMDGSMNGCTTASQVKQEGMSVVQ